MLMSLSSLFIPRIDASNIYGGELSRCGTDPVSSNDKYCSSFNTEKPQCETNSHAGNSYVKCGSYSNITTKSITINRHAKKTSSGSCDCVKYTCTRSNGVNKDPYWAKRDVYKSYTRYSQGTGSQNCPEIEDPKE